MIFAAWMLGFDLLGGVLLAVALAFLEGHYHGM